MPSERRSSSSHGGGSRVNSWQSIGAGLANRTGYSRLASFVKSIALWQWLSRWGQKGWPDWPPRTSSNELRDLRRITDWDQETRVRNLARPPTACVGTSLR